MGKLSKAIGFPTDEEESSDESPVSEVPEKKVSASAEVLAMKQFMRADTAEAKAAAMRDFIEACGEY